MWKIPVSGRRKWLAGFAVLATIVFVVVFYFQSVAARATSSGDLFAGAALVTAVITLSAMALVAFLRWICSWRNFRRFCFGVACLLTLLGLFYTVENIRGKRAWEAHKRILEAQGEKLSMAALTPPPVPDDQNFAFTPLLKPSWDFAHSPTGVVWKDTNGLAHLEKLNAQLRPKRQTNDDLVLGSVDRGTFANLSAWRDFYRGNPDYPQSASPGTPAQEVMVALKPFASDLQELRQAAADRPLCRFPIEYDYEPSWAILLPHLTRLRSLATLTHVQAVAELEAGQSAEAFANLELGLRISDSIRGEPILIDHLVRIAALGINVQVIREGLARHAWTEAQLAELQKYLGALDLLAEYKLAQRGERVLSTAGLDYLRRQGFKTEPMWYSTENDETGANAGYGFNLFPGGWFYQNMLTISRMHQDYTLAAVDEKAHRVFPDVSDKLDKTIAAMRASPYVIFAKLLMPALSNAVRRSARAQNAVDAAGVACALERYRLASGTLPGSLGELVPRFLDKIPNDIIDGQPLRYRRDADGSYVLYSIGWNQKDDGGVIGWTKGKTPKPELRNGDWVWQMPAKL